VAYFGYFLSEKEVEDEVVEVICREKPIESAHGQIFHLISDRAVRISVDDRYLVTPDVRIRLVARKLRDIRIPFVQDARVFDLDVVRRLEIYVFREPF
jgi:hypothetical protein